MQPKLTWLNEIFGKNDYLMGESFTAPDAYAFVTLSWSGYVGVDLTGFPNIQAFLERVRKRPSVVAAIRAEN